MFEIINLTKEKDFNEEDIIRTLNRGIQCENLKDVIFNCIIVDNEYIHKLNKEYRKIDRPTDVITFALEDVEDIKTTPRLLGDIYISIDKAKSQAEEYGHSLKREICFLAIHGFYHLLGYDHQTKEEEKIMFQKQEEVLQYEGITK
jgi:probable rRNA maturation factor